MKLANLAAQGGRKRIFLGLLTASCVFLCLLALLFLILPWLSPARDIFAGLSIATGIATIALLAWLCLSLVYHIHTGRDLPGINGARHLCIRLFLPLMEMAGRLVGLDRLAVRRSFIKVNNELVLAHASPIEPGKILILLPHCIQASACQLRLGPDLGRCAGCNRCQIAQIRKLAEKYGIRAAIATGGTVARRIVVETRPKAIVAVACERDLTSGIQDCFPIPVFGVLNERPLGPCHDTLAVMPALEAAIAFFLGKPQIAASK